MSKIEKFENIKDFRDLDSLKLINKDKSTEKLIDKFKDLQDIFTLIRTYIKNNNKERIYSQKDKVYYNLYGKKIETEEFYMSSSNAFKEKLKIIEDISNNFKDRKISINVPTLKELENLCKNRYGYFWYYSEKDNNYSNYCWNYSSSYYVFGVCNLDNFLDSLDTRNQSLKLETNILKEIDKKISENGIEISEFTDIDKFIRALVEIKVFDDTNVRNLLAKMQKENNEVSPKELLKRYKATLLESKELKDFEVILNYNLLDTDIINGEANPKKFRNLVNLYKTYKDYISCMYIKDDTEDTVELIFNADKIISSAENRDELFNGIEILYKKNKLGITKEEIYNDKNIFYFENGYT